MPKDSIKQPKSRRDTLTLRERKMVQAYMKDGFWFSRAMLKAGYAKSTARTQQARTRNKPRVRKALILECLKQGLPVTDDELRLVGIDPLDHVVRIAEIEAGEDAKEVSNIVGIVRMQSGNAK